MAIAVVLALLATTLVGGTVPASAQETAPVPEAGPDEETEDVPIRCDVGAFSDTKLLDAAVPYPAYRGVSVGETDIVPLPAELPAGRILVSGIAFDEVHFDDFLDFEITLSQFAEQFRVRFLGADGTVVGETDATPDLPDITPFVDFALPSIDLVAPAVSIQLVHAGDGSSPNSVIAECINIDIVGDNPAPESLIRSALCPGDAEGLDPDLFECGFFAVPEERSDPDSRLINIAFAILAGDGESPDPVFYLEGGPGGAPMSFALFIVEAGLGEAAAGRDMVFIDQRGTGYSNPNLVCPFGENPDEDLEAFVQACVAKQLDAGVNLGGYTTVENAADIADLRLALGYEEYNLFGGSYGTDLGLTIMRDRPEGVRSSVLDSVFPPVVNPFIDQGIGSLKMLDAVVSRCAADAACDAGFPDLRAAIIAAFDNMAAEPVVIEGAAADFLNDEPIEIDAFFLLRLTEFSQGNPALPALFHALADPDPAVRLDVATTFVRNDALAEIEAILTEIQESGPPPPPDEEPPLQRDRLRWGVPGPAAAFSDGFFITVVCAEEFPFIDAGGATEPTTETWTGTVLDVVDGLFDLSVECEVFDVPAEDPVVTEAVTSDIPALVLLTDVDTQTVPEWSVLTAETLSNSFLFEFTNLSHVVALSDPCPASIVAQFFSDPTVEPDAACIDDLPEIVYSADAPIDPGPVDDAVADFEKTLEELFGPPPDGPPEEA